VLRDGARAMSPGRPSRTILAPDPAGQKPLRATIPADAEAPAAARRLVRELRGSLAPEVLANAQIVVSELVTNSVQHGGPGHEIRVSCRLGGGRLTLEVEGADGGVSMSADGRPRARGRGFLMVDRLASDWGLVSRGGRLRAWAALELPAPPTRRRDPRAGDLEGGWARL
jgi:anti-sigma regulatory factor (Ser/Thr protein kinase)